MNIERETLDWAIGVPIGWGLLGVAVLMILIALFSEDGEIAAGFSFVLGLFGVFVLLVCYLPPGAEYHTWKPFTGVVKESGSRQVSDGKTMETRFVIEFQSGEVRSCDDTRCALVKPGDKLELACVKEWQYNAGEGYACNFYSNKKAAN